MCDTLNRKSRDQFQHSAKKTSVVASAEETRSLAQTRTKRSKRTNGEIKHSKEKES